MKVAVLGALSLDHYYIVDSFPEDDSMVFAKNNFLSIGGSGANIAINIASKGVDVDFYGGCGSDETAVKIREGMEKYGVNTHLTREEGPSSKPLIIADAEGNRRIISPGGNALYNGQLGKLSGIDLICITDSFPDMAAVLFHENKVKHKIYIPGGCGLYFGTDAVRKVAALADITILSGVEADVIGNDSGSISPVVIVTRGKNSTLIYNNSKTVSVPVETTSKKIVDTTGAGDAFASGFVINLFKSDKIEESVTAGHEFAVKVITKYGANVGVPITDGLN